jgi:hypothetical protein
MLRNYREPTKFVLISCTCVMLLEIVKIFTLKLQSDKDNKEMAFRLYIRKFFSLTEHFEKAAKRGRRGMEQNILIKGSLAYQTRALAK